MPNLALIQKEILNYFQGKETNLEVLSQETLDELAIYKSLVINSAQDYIEKVFSSTCLILQDQIREVVQDYLEQYPSQSAIFYLLAKDFPTFIQSDFFQKKYQPVNFLYELALYEWSEIEIQNSPNIFLFKLEGLAINPVHKILEFEYPVSQIKKLIENSSTAELEELRVSNVDCEREIVIIFRDPESCKTRFFDLTEATLFVLINFVAQNTVENIFKKLSQKYNLTEANSKADYEALIFELKKNNILLE